MSVTHIHKKTTELSVAFLVLTILSYFLKFTFILCYTKRKALAGIRSCYESYFGKRRTA